MPLTLIARSSVGRIALGSVPVVIGREAAADLRIDDPSVAERHAVVRPDANGWTVECSGLGSAGEVPLTPGRPRLLHHGVALVVGDVTIDCVQTDTATTAPDANTMELARRAVAHGMKIGGRDWSVTVVEGPSLGARVTISRQGVTTIGRAEDVDLAIDHATVSRRHAALRVKEGVLQVRDLGTSHGSFLGGSRLAPERWAVWTPERALRLGDVVLVCAPPALQIVEKQIEAIVEAIVETPASEDVRDPEREAPTAESPSAAPAHVEPKNAPVAAVPPAKNRATSAIPALLPWVAAGVLFVTAVAALIWIFWGG